MSPYKNALLLFIPITLSCCTRLLDESALDFSETTVISILDSVDISFDSMYFDRFDLSENKIALSSHMAGIYTYNIFDSELTKIKAIGDGSDNIRLSFYSQPTQLHKWPKGPITAD